MRNLILISLLLTATLLQAQSFGLTDPSFGTNGKVTLDLNGYSDGFHAIEIQPDGRILAAGFSYNGQANQLTLVRFLSNGNVDQSFQQDASINLMMGSFECVAEDIHLMVDGRILVTAHMTSNSISQVMIARFMPTGTLDLSFGNNGIVILSRTAASLKPVAVTANGTENILIAGNITLGAEKGYFFYRMQFDGSMDRILGGDGFVSFFAETGVELSISGLTQYANGQMMVSGTEVSGNIITGFMARHLFQGAYDNGFGINGIATLDNCPVNHSFTSHILNTNGHIFVTGSTHQGSSRNVLAASFDQSGMANASFGTQGWIDHSAGAGLAYGQDIQLGPQGIIYIAGHLFNGINNDMMLMALKANGSLNTEFSSNGYITVALNNNHDYAKALAIQADGQIILAGMTDNGLNFDMALVRLNGISSTVGMNEDYAAEAINAWFNGSSIQMDLTSNARIMVLDLSGRVCFDQVLNSGNHSIQFNSTPGVHILNVITGQQVQSKKIMI